MKIPVVFAGQTVGKVEAEELQLLIDDGSIISFTRSDGQVVKIGFDPVRGSGGKKYRGPERRGNVLFC